MVHSITLDTFVDTNQVDRIDFMKIDVEGVELGLLYGGVKSISEFIPNMIIENHPGGKVNLELMTKAPENLELMTKIQHQRHNLMIDMSNRRCSLCGSDKTYIEKKTEDPFGTI